MRKALSLIALAAGVFLSGLAGAETAENRPPQTPPAQTLPAQTQPAQVQATCAGRNLFGDMPAAQIRTLRARTDAIPYARGNLWRATRDGQTLHLLGTYHLADPRHAATMARVEPMIAAARNVLVEAGPEEEAALKQRIADDPSVLVITDGPTLPELLPAADWQRLSRALLARKIPPFMAAKFRPWYLSVMLAVPPCGMEAMAQNRGLDRLVMEAAARQGRPMRALEPYDTLFRIFDTISEEDQISMVRSVLVTEDRAADYSQTMSDAYFAGDTRIVWELMRELSLGLPGYTPERVDAEYARMEEVLMNGRNRGWITVIEDAAKEGPAFAAFGALHLSGEEGVLNLLARNGWTLEELPL